MIIPVAEHTLLNATVPFAHHSTPPENSEGILFFVKICLKSDNLISLTNTVECWDNYKLRGQLVHKYSEP